jgi:hypothetical protein
LLRVRKGWLRARKGRLRGEERLAEGEACVGACILEKASHVEGTIDNLDPPTVLITRLNIRAQLATYMLVHAVSCNIPYRPAD